MDQTSSGRVIRLGEIPARLPAAPNHLEHRARVIVVKAQVEIVKIGDRRRDAQAKSAAGNAMTAGGSVKSLEYLVAFRRLDPYAGVADADDRTAVFLADRYAHPAILWGELDRIADQVRHCLAHQIAVAEHLHRR